MVPIARIPILYDRSNHYRIATESGFEGFGRPVPRNGTHTTSRMACRMRSNPEPPTPVIGPNLPFTRPDSPEGEKKSASWAFGGPTAEGHVSQGSLADRPSSPEYWKLPPTWTFGVFDARLNPSGEGSENTPSWGVRGWSPPRQARVSSNLGQNVRASRPEGGKKCPTWSP